MEPWEALDLDDSDLSNFLRPCKKNRHHPLASPPKTNHGSSVSTTASQSEPTFQLNLQPPRETLTDSQSQLLLRISESTAASVHLIPGPAGAVQAAMQRRAQGDQKFSGNLDEPFPTQEFIRRVVEVGDENDDDFNTSTWLCALDFLRREGMVNSDSVSLGTPLSSIKKHLNIERAAQVVAVVKSCTPNGFGDLIVTLKDPTSTVGASIHRKVFAEGEFGRDICVGSVLILQKVAVFFPTSSACFLNITLHNIVKVFSKDSGPPSAPIYPAPSVRHTAPSIESNEKSWMLGNTLSLPQERTAGIITNLRLNSRLRETQEVDKQMEEDVAIESSHFDNGDSRQRNAGILAGQKFSQTQGKDIGITRPVEVTLDGELQIEMEDRTDPFELAGGENPAWNARCNGSSTNLVDISDNQETGIENQKEKENKIIISQSLIPHWTEEQLDELLAFD